MRIERLPLSSLASVFSLVLLALIVGCGGGSNSFVTPTPTPVPTPTPTPGDFTVSLSPSTLTASPGSTAPVETITLVYTGGFNAPVTLTAMPPSGVTCANSCTDNLFGSTVATFSFIVGNAVSLGTYSFNITATGGTITHSVSLSIVVQSPPPIVPNRSQWVRTDDSPSDIVFDHSRQLIYSANRLLNRVEVISPASTAIVKTIPVPKPIGLDITPDNNFLYVAAEVQQMYKIDLNAQQVTDRIQFSGTTFSGLAAPPFPDQPATLANGSTLLRVGCGRINPCTTETELFEFDPVSRTFKDVASADLRGLVGLMARSADHAKVLVARSDSGGNLDLFDSASNSFTAQASFFGNFVGSIASNANGSQFAIVLDCCQLVILDGKLNQVFSRSNGAFLEGGLVYSADGSRLYVPETDLLPVIDVIDTTTFAQIGQIPDLQLDGHPRRPTIAALTDDGLLLGKAERGLSLVDGSVTPSMLPATAPILGFESQGALRPSHIVAGSTATSIGGAGFLFTPQVIFGAQPATSVSYVNTGQINVTAPPPVPPPDTVNVKALFPGGFFTIAPDGYSYAPKARFQTVTGGNTAGGTPLEIIGYGLAYTQSQLSVTVGGQPATITNISSFSGISPFSLPIHRLDIVTPPAAIAADTSIVINTPDGSASVPYQYVAKQVVPIQGQASQVVFDKARNQVYWSNSTANRVDVLSLNTSQLSSFPTGPKPIGLALTPDGSRLLSANAGNNTVSIINPDQPSATQTVSVDTGDKTVNPIGVAALAGGSAFVSMAPSQVFGCVGVLRQVDLTTLSVVTRSFPFASCETQDFQLVASGDGTEAFVGNLLWQKSTDTLQTSILSDSSARAASLTGNIFASGQVLADGQLRRSYFANWPELLDCPFCEFAGEKLHSSGSLLYLALANIDNKDRLQIFDVHTGNLLRTIDMPELMAPSLNGLAIDDTGATAFVLTQAALTIVRMASVPLSIGFLEPDTGSSGTALTLHGSGFQSGATVTIGGQTTSTTFVDGNTLSLFAPSLTPGVYAIAVANPNGESYSLDAAYVAH